MASRLLACLALALAAGPSAAEESTPARRKVTSVMTLELTPVGASAEVAQNLSAVIAAELGRYDSIRAVSRRELSSLLDFDRQKQLAGCSEESCLAPLMGAMGVDKLLTGQLGRVEGVYVLTLQLLDARTAKVDARLSRTVSVDANQLVDFTKATVTDLIGPQASTKNQPPRLAVARSLTSQRGDPTSLDASRCYDPDGDPLRVRWRQIEGPPALLENAEKRVANFTPAEVGEYLFGVTVSDGRANLEETVKVQVREPKRFWLSANYQQLLSFNRMVGPDAAGHAFRNRAPIGGMVLGAVQLNESWQLTGELAAGYMRTYPEDSTLESSEWLSTWELGLTLGVRRLFRFDGFDLFGSAGVGTTRLFLTATQGATSDANVRAQTVQGDLSAGVNLPVSEWVGLTGRIGVRAREATDSVLPFSGIDFRVVDDAFLWGVNASAGVYLRF